MEFPTQVGYGAMWAVFIYGRFFIGDEAYGIPLRREHRYATSWKPLAFPARTFPSPKKSFGEKIVIGARTLGNMSGANLC